MVNIKELDINGLKKRRKKKVFFIFELAKRDKKVYVENYALYLNDTFGKIL